jgi:damage-control phosphatase, subfamily III
LSFDELRTLLIGYHEYSFAHATMGHRLPTILGKAIDDTVRTLNEQSSEDEIIDLVQCIERMDKLMTDLSGNAKLRPIIDDGEADVALWNKEIAKYFQGIKKKQYPSLRVDIA